MKKINGSIVLSFALLAISACGGGSSDSGDSVMQPPPAADQDPGGIWFGTVFNSTLGQSWEIIGITLSSGESRYIDSRGTQYISSHTVDGNTFSGTSFAVAALGTTFIDGSTTTTGSTSGTIVERSRVSATYSVGTGEQGTIELFYDSTYERSSSFAKMSGTWTDPQRNTFTVEANGSIFGQDGFGCVYTGNVSIIDPLYNVYRLTINVANCADINGAYTGLGTIGDRFAENDDQLFIFQVSNDSWALTSTLEKDAASVVDPTPPSQPQQVLAEPNSSSSINVSWEASTDDVAVASYRVFRDGMISQTTTATNIVETGLSASTQYCFAVAAVDAAGNESAQSMPEVCATTLSLDGAYGSITIQGSNLPAQFIPITGLGPSAGAADGFLQTAWQDGSGGALAVSIADDYFGVNGANVVLIIGAQEYECSSGFAGMTGDCSGASYDRVTRTVTFSNVELIGPGGASAIVSGALVY